MRITEVKENSWIAGNRKANEMGYHVKKRGFSERK